MDLNVVYNMKNLDQVHSVFCDISSKKKNS